MTGDTKHRTLKDQLEYKIARAERPDIPRHYRGGDWYQLTDEEEAVFAIDRARFPRMITVWECYQAFKRIVNDAGFDSALIEQARQQHPEWCDPGLPRPDVSANEFVNFAKAYDALTVREAYAIYAKYEFWEVRHGVVHYRDEPKQPA